MKWPSPGRAALVGATFLGTLPLWTLPLMSAGTTGFLAYLGLSHAYYGGARQVFGGHLFPAREFGIIPQGMLGLLLAGGLYGLMGAAAGWGLVTGVKRWGRR